jgi:hypothetical protein
MVRRNSRVTIFQRSAHGGEVGGESGKEFWRSLVLIVLSCFVQRSLFFGVVVVFCAMGSGSGSESDRAEQESSRLRHRTLCQHC